MVYFPRNFNLKPVLHNYPDLFEKPRWMGLAQLPTRDHCYVWLLKKYMLSAKHNFSHFQNNDKMSCSALKVVNIFSAVTSQRFSKSVQKEKNIGASACTL